MKKRILVVGTANMDFVQRMPRLPMRGETMIVKDESIAYHPGGKGVNSAVAFARLGLDTIFCSRVGDDSFGKKLIYACRENGIDTRFVAEDSDTSTGIASVMVEEDGSNRIIVYPGAGANLCPEDVEEAFTSYPDGVFTQFEAPLEAVEAAAFYASRGGVPLFVDAGPAKENFPLEKLSQVEILSPNEVETEVLCGIRPDGVDTCLKASIALSKMVKTRYVVLKLGGRGAFCYDGKYYHIIPAYKVKAVDTTGAGDVFTAAMCSAYMQNGNILAAVKFGCLAGALSVTRNGASSAPTIAEIRQFAESVD